MVGAILPYPVHLVRYIGLSVVVHLEFTIPQQLSVVYSHCQCQSYCPGAAQACPNKLHAHDTVLTLYTHKLIANVQCAVEALYSQLAAVHVVIMGNSTNKTSDSSLNGTIRLTIASGLCGWDSPLPLSATENVGEVGGKS